MPSDTRGQAITTLNGMIKDIKMAMLTTVDDCGALHSRPMATQQVEFDGDLWFFTGADTGKVNEIRHDAQVNVAYAQPDKNRYVSVSGVARLVRDQAKMQELWSPIYKAFFPKGLDDPDLALLHITVQSAEYWDGPSGALVQLTGFVKALVTGQPYEADNERMNLVQS